MASRAGYSDRRRARTCSMHVRHAFCMYTRQVSPSVQIRDVPGPIHRTLRARAAAAGQSLSEYLLDELTRIAERPPVADVLARAAQRHGGAGIDEIVHAVRSGRDLE